jgi:DNA-directed RNA polymerase specialized sigma24 family protein
MSKSHSDNARLWLLEIVRHACFSSLNESPPAERTYLDDHDDSLHGIAAASGDELRALGMRESARVEINQAIAALPFGYREVLVLR